MPVQVVTESDTGLGGSLGTQLGIWVIPHYVNHRGRSYSDLELDRREFLAWLEKGEEIATAHPTVQDLTTAFMDAGKDGDPVLYVPISSQYSKTYALARSLREQLPGLRIKVFDSQRAAGGHAMVALEAARLARAGRSIEEIISLLTEEDECIDEIMVIDSLRQLAREGRTRNAEKALGSIITVKLLVAHREGLSTPIGKVRTNQQALDQIVAKIKQALAKCKGTDLRVLVEYGADEEWAKHVIDRLTREFSPRKTWKVWASPSTTLHIGAHGWSVAWVIVHE